MTPKQYKYTDNGNVTPPDPRADPVCPTCGRVLIDLADYDPGADMTVLEGSPQDEEWSDNYNYNYNNDYDGPWLLDPIFRFLKNTLIDWPLALLKKRRLDHVLQDYPNSLYCSGCGYLWRRR